MLEAAVHMSVGVWDVERRRAGGGGPLPRIGRASTPPSRAEMLWSCISCTQPGATFRRYEETCLACARIFSVRHEELYYQANTHTPLPGNLSSDQRRGTVQFSFCNAARYMMVIVQSGEHRCELRRLLHSISAHSLHSGARRGARRKARNESASTPSPPGLVLRRASYRADAHSRLPPRAPVPSLGTHQEEGEASGHDMRPITRTYKARTARARGLEGRAIIVCSSRWVRCAARTAPH